MTTVDRPSTRVADLTHTLLDEAVIRVGPMPDLAAVRELAHWLAGHTSSLVDELAAADVESRRTGEAVVLAEAAGGHVMVVRHFPAGEPTPIHGHGGWGAVVVIIGRGRYETWEPTRDGYAHLVEVRDLGPGDTLAWPNPPHDVHRQVGLAGGATELTIFARHPYHTWAPQFHPAGDAPHLL